MQMLYLWITCLLLLACCQSSPPSYQVEKFSQTVMTIDYHISIGDSLSPSKKIEVQQIITDTFQEIDAIYNKWNPQSELSKINRLSAHTPLTLSPDLYKFLVRLDSFVKLSEGRFDPTIEPLQKLWQKHLELGETPSHQEIEALKPCIGWHTCHLADGIIVKENSLTQLDLGGVAKGLCVDLLIERIHSAGLDHLFVEWGGEIRTLGRHPSGRPWKIYISGLANPDPSAALAHVELNDLALATSGDYFQYWKVKNRDGQEIVYCHIINPLTLTPLEVRAGSVASSSLLAKDCTTADALAKVMMLFGSIEEARLWLAKVQGEYPELTCWLAERE